MSQPCTIASRKATSPFTPLLPNRPVGGRTKADVSNQCASVRWSVGRLPFVMRSGKPPEVLVPDAKVKEQIVAISDGEFAATEMSGVLRVGDVQRLRRLWPEPFDRLGAKALAWGAAEKPR